MISVVIPTLNEAARITEVVRFAQNFPAVSDIIVVDDGSIDGTPEIAAAVGARVVTSTLLGKGASMEDGLWAARNETVVYLDGDLAGLHNDLIVRLTRPIIDNRADFVKAKFSRTAGRVTTLTAKPLLRLFFPELAGFEQPLGGIIAGRRSILRNLRFESDYGVDVGLLIDAAASGARIAEIDIGHIEHDSQPLDVLGDMAMQVVRVIVERASEYSRLSLEQLREVQEVERSMQAEMATFLQRRTDACGLVLLDMDGVLLKGRYVCNLAQRTNRQAKLNEFLDHPTLSDEERTRKIAQIFQGVAIETFSKAAREMPLISGAAETVVELRKSGYRVGIVTDSFYLAADIVRRRVFADFCVAHVMRFRDSIATGEVTLSPLLTKTAACSKHSLCKQNALKYLADKWDLPVTATIAIGDGLNDVCMLQSAGLGIAFEPKRLEVCEAADAVAAGDLREVLAIIRQSKTSHANDQIRADVCGK